jgi:hypothetical protein
MTTKKQTEKRPSIIVKNIYFEKANPGNSTFQRLLQKDIFKDPIMRYWLARALDHVGQLSKVYLEERARIAKKYSRKYDEDGEQKDRDGKVIHKWKKGDSITFPDGSVAIDDADAFREDLNKLQEEEVDLGIPQIKFNELINLPIEEEMLIIPLMEEIDEDTLEEMYKKSQAEEKSATKGKESKNDG